MNKILFFVLLLGLLAGQGSRMAQAEILAPGIQSGTTKGASAAASADDYSGMYTFLRDGEYVQISVEDKGKLTGFVSRYGDLDSDRGAFLDQFIKQGALDGHNLTFTTETVHGTWFEFKGTAGRGEAKTVNDEGYYVLKGTLTQHSTDADQKDVAKSREVVFKSFPEDVSAPSRQPKN